MFVIYYFVTPLYFYFQGRKTIWGDEENYFGVGVDISDFYGISLIYYGIANLLFICGYILFKEKQGKEKTIRSIEKISNKRNSFVIWFMYFPCYYKLFN